MKSSKFLGGLVFLLGLKVLCLPVSNKKEGNAHFYDYQQFSLRIVMIFCIEGFLVDNSYW